MARNILRRSVGLSFVLATLALTWYASIMYMHHGKGEKGGGHKEQQQPSSSNSKETSNNSNSNSNSNSNNTTTRNSNSNSNSNSAQTTQRNDKEHNGEQNETKGDHNSNSNSNHQQQQQQQQQESASPNPSAWDSATKYVYALGSSWWILTCFLAYLGPLAVVADPRKRWFRRNSSNSSNSTKNKISKPSTPRRFWNSCCCDPFKRMIPSRRAIILWGLVIGPSLWVFLYGTYVGIASARGRIAQSKEESAGSENDDSEHGRFLEWIYVLVLASAMPAGTAGMVSMGIYVFGTVTKHSPLWSAYVVLPNANAKPPVAKSSDAATSTNTTTTTINATSTDSNNGSDHKNLMEDALRLHQWAGYVTLAWFFLHAVLYCLIYGFRGVQSHFQEAVDAAASAITTTNGTDNSTYTTNTTDDASNTTTTSTTLVFLGAVWNALIPPPECRPILGWGHNNENENQGEQQHQRSRRKLFKVLFEEDDEDDRLLLVTANDSANTSSVSAAIQNVTEISNQTPSEASSSSFNSSNSNANATTTKEQQQQRQQQGTSSCYGYYRNFNGFLAIVALLLLAATSLAFVRRTNYRFFYVSHLVTATVFVLTMVFHMKRIVIYLFPSLVCYFATTIPTLVQGWIGAIVDGGVHIEDCTVLISEQLPSKTIPKTIGNSNISKKDPAHEVGGIAELAFWVEPISGSVHEVAARDDETFKNGRRISHRPKSVRICVPSISLLWYPFTVIEPTTTIANSNINSNNNNNINSNTTKISHEDKNTTKKLVKCKILFGTVGYFTKSLWKRLHELQQLENSDVLGEGRRDTENALEAGDACGKDRDEIQRDDFFDDEDDAGRNDSALCHRHRPRPPLILVDGFYSGATDWIDHASHHDVVLIAAGGTGVTPFLTFLPRLLLHYKRFPSSRNDANNANYDDSSEGLVGGIGGGGGGALGDGCNPPATVSFLWCCRDEALIKHVLATYLMPLFRMAPEPHGHERLSATKSGVRFRLIIHNTSRDRSDTTPLEIDGSGSHPRNCSSSNSRSFMARGLPMRPSRLQHHPHSSRSKVLAGALTFLSTALFGVWAHLWSNDKVQTNRHSFSVRAYGIYAILVWSCLVGILAEVVWRCWSKWGSPSFRKGYAIANKDDHERPPSFPAQGPHFAKRERIESKVASLVKTEANAEDYCLEEPSRGWFGPTSLAPGSVYSEKSIKGQTTYPVLELSLSNGRPILEHGRGHLDDDDDDESGGHVLTPSEAILQEAAGADRPGVFYCGPGGLLERIKANVNTGRNERRQQGGSDNESKQAVADCAFYEESFEM